MLLTIATAECLRKNTKLANNEWIKGWHNQIEDREVAVPLKGFITPDQLFVFRTSVRAQSLYYNTKQPIALRRDWKLNHKTNWRSVVTPEPIQRNKSQNVRYNIAVWRT